MCGISIIINKENHPVDENEIRRMNDLIIHRGPDDCGYFHGSNFSLGHRRLSILDLSSDGRQPMTLGDRYTITFNGEVYNYLELRQELSAKGYRFFSNSDTEVVLASYAHWGEACVERFNGMWAFAIYDAQERKIFCSRDRFGIKPLYYLDTDAKFILSSEIKQLMSFQKKNCANTRVLIDYLVCSFAEHTDETFFKGIRIAPSSHNLIYDLKSHRFHLSRYYRIKFDDRIGQLTEEESAALYREQLEAAIRLRLRSDVKVGTCLSGGLDSSSVATLADREYAKSTLSGFNAITARSIEKATDESAFARLVAENGGLNWEVVTPTTQDFINTIDEIVRLQEEPFVSPSIFMQYFVMKRAHDVGCTVMLDGQGGDETLLGYPKYYPAAYIDMWRNNGLAETIRDILRSSKNNIKMSPLGIAKYSLGGLLPFFRKQYFINSCSFVKKEFLNPFSFFDDLAQSYFDIRRLQTLEIERTNLPILLRYEDRSSMFHSVEARLPMIDYKVLEIALSINIAYKIKAGWTKYILRKAMEGDLPQRIVWRKNKLSFNAPEDTWLTAHQVKMAECIRGSQLLRQITNQKQLLKKYDRLNFRLKWRLFNIAKWEEIFNVATC